ncbi:MAG: hypothetical protein CMC08_03740 [Flavobacteriaceae bacterium]|nr:hypothetical protein [Flavobacteriaceae bacterium]
MKTILKLIALLLWCAPLLHAQDRNLLIQGTVTSMPDNQPIANAVVTIKDTFIETETGANGVFTLSVAPGDQLLVNALLMYPKTVMVSTNEQPLEIRMQYNAEVLEAITVRERQEKEEYVEKDFNKRNKNEVGYSYEDVQTRFINGVDVDLYTVAKKIPMLDVVGNPQEGQVVYNSRMRGALGGSKVPIQVVVDGIPVDQNALGFIDPRQVTNMTVYRSLAATVKYGAFGAGGVISITTTNSGDIRSSRKKTPSLLVKGNNYNEGILPISDNITISSAPSMQEIRKSPTLSEAQRTYNEQRDQPETRNLVYYLDMANYFSKWGAVYEYRVLSDLFRQANNNPRILRAIAFELEEKGHLAQATFVMEKLLEVHPDNIQAYRDVARLYAATGRYKLATALYKQMIYNTVPNLDFEPIHPIVFNEFRHLIANHKSKIDFRGIPNEFLSVNFKKDIRIVLEYTNPLAEFEVQFVSPTKKYFTWRHSAFYNEDVIEDEISKGYAIKEFTIEDADFGNWLVNVKSIDGNTGAIPTLLKYTIYQDYGLPTETKEIKVINLANQSEKGTLDTFIY